MAIEHKLTQSWFPWRIATGRATNRRQNRLKIKKGSRRRSPLSFSGSVFGTFKNNTTRSQIQTLILSNETWIHTSMLQ